MKYTKKIKYKIKNKGGSNNSNSNLIIDRRFSTGTMDGTTVGLIHITESVGINLIRNMGTNVANLFGNEGYETVLYNNVKEKAFNKLKKIVNKDNYNVSNLKMDIETTDKTIFCHLMGTLCKTEAK
jgi:hypothetical protein